MNKPFEVCLPAIPPDYHKPEKIEWQTGIEICCFRQDVLSASRRKQ